MSFASDCKTELVSVVNTECCETAQSYALLLFGRAFSDSEMAVLTENETVAGAYTRAFRSLTGADIIPDVTEAGNYKISVTDKKILHAALNAVGHNTKGTRRRINFAVFQNPCCFSAFLRGAFLACGTVTDPEKEYHLEFAVSSKGLCDDFIKLFDEFEPVPKMTVRAGSYIVYFKNSGDIEDILATMGAQENSLRLMGAKMYKDIRNTVNRKVNFENANLARTIAASSRQYDAICFIMEHSGLDSLPEELRGIAKLRYENTDLSSAEISKILPESITVSGVNHRFNRIIKIAEQMKEKERE